MAFWYSVRFSRRKVAVRPGLGSAAAARSSSASSAATTDSYVRSSGRGLPDGGHLPRGQLPHHLLPDRRMGLDLVVADGIEGEPAGLVDCSLWQPAQ